MDRNPKVENDKNAKIEYENAFPNMYTRMSKMFSKYLHSSR